MQIDLTNREFRLLLDMVYIGNWVLNSTRLETERFEEYDNLESKLFALCRTNGMRALVSDWRGAALPSRAYEEGGIHDAIAYYEDNIFYDLLAEALARRDMNYADITDDNYDELEQRIGKYMDEFEQTGVDRLSLDT